MNDYSQYDVNNYYNPNNIYGNGSNQANINMATGQPGYENHAVSHIIERTVWFVIISYIASWFFRKCWAHKLATVIAIVSASIGCYCADMNIAAKPVFWSMALVLCAALGRIIWS
jgi:hypothetical protein